VARVFKLPFQAEHLEKLSVDERVLLLLLGYSANQIVMLQKLIWFCTNGPVNEGEIELLGSFAQSQMLLRLLTGVLSESWRVITTRYLQSKVVQGEYSALLKEPGPQALDNLKKQFGKNGLITKIRNNYSFHFPDNSEVEAAFKGAVAAESAEINWAAYVSNYGANTLFQFSELVFNRGVMQQIGADDELESHRLLMAELGRAANDLVTFANAFAGAVWARRFGEHGVELSAEDVEATSPDTIFLPFIVDQPTR
jgi:hypothetical protein